MTQNRNFLDIHTTSPDDLRQILTNARAIKDKRATQPRGFVDTDCAFQNRIVALIFEKPSTRTRVSFDIGVRQMGGQTVVLSGADMQMGHGESIADTARVLSRYVDMVMIRTFAEDVLAEWAHYADVPVINGLTDRTHPCQIMADIMTYEEHRGAIKGKKVVYLGDGNNVCNSLIQGAGQFGYDLVFSGPQDLSPDAEFIDFARGRGAGVSIEPDAGVAVAGADLVLTDTWVSMHDSPDTALARHNLLSPYRVDADLMARAGGQALFMHCLPAHRGEEVTSEVLDGAQSVVFDEAENRLHVQKAIMRWCLGV